MNKQFEIEVLLVLVLPPVLRIIVCVCVCVLFFFATLIYVTSLLNLSLLFIQNISPFLIGSYHSQQATDRI